jgi:hypothetical protein
VLSEAVQDKFCELIRLTTAAKHIEHRGHFITIAV